MLKKSLIIIVLITLVAFGWKIFWGNSENIVIDNAYLSGTVFKLYAPRSGYIEDISIEKGLLFESDKALITYDKTSIELDIEQLAEQYRLDIQKEISKCFDFRKMLVENQRAKLAKDYNDARNRKVSKKANSSLLLADDFIAQRTTEFLLAQKIYEKTTIELQQLKFINYQSVLTRPSVKRSEALLRERLYEKSLYEIILPFAGYVYDKLVYSGQYVNKDDLMAILIPKQKLMVEANVIESKVQQIKKYQRVEIMPDTHSNIILQGYIHSIVPSAATTFSNLPRNNTNSNWIKVAQRVPVLIEFTLPQTEEMLLAIGTSARVNVFLNDSVKPNNMQKLDKEKIKSDKSNMAEQDIFVKNVAISILSPLMKKEIKNCWISD